MIRQSLGLIGLLAATFPLIACSSDSTTSTPQPQPQPDASASAYKVGDLCIPSKELCPTSGDDKAEGNAYVDTTTTFCGEGVCLINHFRGRVTCPFGNLAGFSTMTGAEADCYVPGTTDKVTAPVVPQCRERKDNVYCSCLCASDDASATLCECPSDFQCDTVTKLLNGSNMKAGDKYCVRSATANLPAENYELDGKLCCNPSNPSCTDRCDKGDMCGYTNNKAGDELDTSKMSCTQ